MSTARTLWSAAGPSMISRSAAPNSAIHALRVSGRFSVIRPTGPDCSHRTVSEELKAGPPGSFSPRTLSVTFPDVLIDEVAWLGHSGFRIAAGARTIYIDP